MTKSRRPKRPGRVSEAAPAAPAAAVVETTVFRSGNSDAVRLPKRFGLLGKRVHVRRLGSGRLLIEATRKRACPAGWLESFGGGRLTEDFAAPPRPAADPKDEARATNVLRRDADGDE